MDVSTKTHKKADEAKKWSKVMEKGKSKEPISTPTPTIINLTLAKE